MRLHGIKLTRKTGSVRSGVAAVEFAFLAPFLITLVLGMIEFGRLMMVEQVLVNGAREGCRSACLPGGTVANARTQVATYLAASSVTVADPSTQITITPDPSTSAQGTAITVKVSVPFTSVSWLPTPVFLGGKSLSASIVMRLESNNT